MAAITCSHPSTILCNVDHAQWLVNCQMLLLLCWHRLVWQSCHVCADTFTPSLPLTKLCLDHQHGAVQRQQTTLHQAQGQDVPDGQLCPLRPQSFQDHLPRVWQSPVTMQRTLLSKETRARMKTTKMMKMMSQMVLQQSSRTKVPCCDVQLRGPQTQGLRTALQHVSCVRLTACCM